MFGLDNLLYFASSYPKCAKFVLESSSDPTLWFAFAITGLNITAWVRQWLVDLDDRVASLFFWMNEGGDEALLQGVHEVYCLVFFRFAHYWAEEKPASVMQFGQVAAGFREALQLPGDLKMVRKEMLLWELWGGKKRGGLEVEGDCK